ncbi:MAG: glycine cleavage system aminomethyltransferase GcvT [Propionibacteriaceae bacterium]|nr:glycine cleavage system aminomethyltransferase GcvT [Propionibacteriaceae bacterium]
MSDLIESALVSVHREAGAKFAPFGGWNMPVEYSGVLAEHKAVRESVGIFDVSHLGTFLVEGEDAAAYINTRLTNDLNRISPGQAQYTLLLNQTGGVVDDMIIYLLSESAVMVIPNAANSDEVIRRLRDNAPAHLTWTDRHTQEAIIAVQGPNSASVLDATGLPSDIGYMSFVRTELASQGQVVSLSVCRTGYTGEHGYEIVVPAQSAVTVWESLFRNGAQYGVVPCGLGARDTLRTEMGYPLHGHDLSPTISPVEARVSWAVGWKKEHFDGDEAVRAQRKAGATRTLLGIRACGRGIPRPGMQVFDNSGRLLGEVTSGTFSPTEKVGIGLALMTPAPNPAKLRTDPGTPTTPVLPTTPTADPPSAGESSADTAPIVPPDNPPGVAVGDHVLVEMRGRNEEFEVVSPPFVPPRVND